MIKNIKSLTMAEAKELLKKTDTEKSKEIIEFIKKFTKLGIKDVAKLKEQLQKIPKLKEENIAKIIDFLPKDAEDLRKIFSVSEINLEEDETNKIIEIIKQIKTEEK